MTRPPPLHPRVELLVCLALALLVLLVAGVAHAQGSGGLGEAAAVELARELLQRYGPGALFALVAILGLLWLARSLGFAQLTLGRGRGVDATHPQVYGLSDARTDGRRAEDRRLRDDLERLERELRGEMRLNAEDVRRVREEMERLSRQLQRATDDQAQHLGRLLDGISTQLVSIERRLELLGVRRDG